MGNYTREEILQMVEEEDVEFIRLQFTDMFGAIKNIAVTARELPRALDNRCMINGEQIAGMDMEKGSDLYLSPILDTFAILPWRPQQGKVARMICDLYFPDGTPYKNSPRYILENVAGKAQEEGYTCYIDPECEFFLFHTDDNGNPTTVTHEQAGYLDISPLDLGENARRDMVLTLEDMGMEVESSHHEAAPAQHEIDFRYGEIRKTADCITTFKMAVRIVAKRHGLHATFMPKPKTEANGSGMHIQFSLIKNGENVFECSERPGELSEDAYYFIGGLLAHSKEMALITNPLVNSYKRLVPGYDAPTELTWTENNQNSLVRIPVTRGEGIRVELRSPDASANPYVVLAVCLAAGLDGIKNKITPTKSSNLAAQDQQAEHLPETLKEAIDYFESSSWVKEVLGEEFCRQYVSAKKNEWLRYTRQVTDWEIAEYLYRL
ncbi:MULTISPECIES: type I glutamate--ammonia ligase [Blautia]|uniref:Glutamine synthetase n=1 Tax=Blautia obeum TaxID=40520 RepID=A0A414JC93_9FIRM|nr:MULTISPECIES: type I glutamate--ammonia ligase [Blautia]RHA47183.1 type I glutamate--ammonia ligase [Blautia obeum]RHE42180.1 type I glutamate--ammonia ligase [Blautia obeum]